MLGSLGKWLRILGFDTVIPPDIEDAKIDEMALKEARILLTRDRRFSEMAGSPCLLIRSLDVDGQLKEVDGEFEIFKHSKDNKTVLTRCSICNHSLKEIEKGTAEGHVPDGVYEQQDIFWSCEGCGRYYWAGTHYREMLKKLIFLEKSRPKKFDFHTL